MNFNLSDRKIIGLLLVALTFQVILLLWHMEIIKFGHKEETNTSKIVAGKINNIQNSLKRRPLDSLIWEPSAAPSEVYYYDSILTLSESTANIELENGTQINLSENTLITIEPIEESSESEIRIQLSQGNLQARNPYKITTIQDKKISLKLAKDSDVQVLKGKDGQYEVQVKKGSANLIKDQKALQINENQIIEINKTEIKKTEITNALIWSDLKTIRKYSYNTNESVNLEWQGKANELLVYKENNLWKTLDLDPQKKQKEMKLPLGEYRLSLSDGTKQSLRLPVQIWKAQPLQLIKPLPRNREKYGTYEFIWTGNSRFTSYEVEIKTNLGSQFFPSKLNRVSIPLNKDMDIQWSVWGIDQKGYRNPPKYYYPLYIRENPFAPPKLKKPKLIDPKKPKTSLLDFIIPKAYASNRSQALFTWEEIPGADIYFIEISEDKEFRNPILSKTIKKNSFQWMTENKNKTYYWRVAAGDSRGKMGQFTEPTLVEWQILKPKPKKIVKKPIEQKKVIKKIESKKKILSEEPKVLKKPEPKENKIEHKETRWLENLSVMYNPTYSIKNFAENGSTKANLNGMDIINFWLYSKWNLTENWKLNTLFNYNQSEYEPTPKDQFPFQENLNYQRILGFLDIQSDSSNFGYGLFIGNLTDVERLSFERIGTTSVMAYGPSLGLYGNLWLLENQTHLAIIYDGNRIGAVINQKLIYYLYSSIFTGVDLQLMYLKESSSSIFDLNTGVLIGISF